MDTMRALKQVIMFKDVPEPVLEVVARAAEEISVPAGQTLVTATETPDALYVIRSGTLSLRPEGGAFPPVLFGTGEAIGDVQFADGEPAGATIIALERVDLLVIRSAKLAEALAGHPDVGYQLYRAIARSLAGRLRRAVGMLAFASERHAHS
jgi:CRP-like cAMP-binding protein